MDIEINPKELQKTKVFLATVVYNECSSIYTTSVFELAKLFTRMSIPLDIYHVRNCSHLTVARNIAVDKFMASDATHMLFVDADIGFRPEDVITMLSLQINDSPYDIIGGTYLHKTIQWERVLKAIDQGLATDKYGGPTNLNNYVSNWLFKPITDTEGKALTSNVDPFEVEGIGTGFMLVRRATFQLFQDNYPNLRFRKYLGDDQILMQYFHMEVTNLNTMEFIPEDYWFSNKIRQVGGRIWICPWISLSHAGCYIFGGPFSSEAK